MDPSVTTVQYIVYRPTSAFVDDVMFSNNQPGEIDMLIVAGVHHVEGHVGEILLLNNVFSDCRYMP